MLLKDGPKRRDVLSQDSKASAPGLIYKFLIGPLGALDNGRPDKRESRAIGRWCSGCHLSGPRRRRKRGLETE